MMNFVAYQSQLKDLRHQDAFAEAGDMGIKAENTFNFEATGKGNREAYESSSDMVASYRKEPDYEGSEEK